MPEVSRRRVLGGLVHTAGATALTTLPLGTGTAAAATARTAGPVSGIRPVRLTTEHVTDPLGLDVPAPRLAWQLAAPGRDRRQTAYRILVATDPGLLRPGRADVWDTGRVASADQTGREYAGPALVSRTRYHWSVRVWDEAGRPGPWSAPAWFETALLADDDWAADWIGSGAVVPPSVRTLPPQQYDDVPLRLGHTLGQDFVSEGPLSGVALLFVIGGPEGGSGPAGCVVTVRREGPDGEELGRVALTGLTPDQHGYAAGRLDLAEPAAPGRFYVEIGGVSGELSWPSMADGRVYAAGTAYADGAAVDGDRWLFGLAPPPPANPLLRREFHLDEPVVSARLYLIGLGHGVAWINGRRVSDHVLDPASTDYDVRALYVTHDVTTSLRRGRNALGVALGRGFFSTRAPHSDGSHLAPWLAEPQLRAQLEIVLHGGRRLTIGTDTDWSATEGPTTYEGLYAGESFDARRERELGGWTRPGHAALGWRPASVMPGPRGRLEAYAGEPMRAGEPVGPVEVTRPAPGIRIYDFGRVRSGWVRLRADLPAGTTVRMVHAEKLGPDGRVPRDVPGGNLNPAIDGRYQVDEYTAAGRGVEEWQPTFNLKSFRYVEVTGTSRPLDLSAVLVHSDVADTMDLELDQPTLQWIADTVRRTNLNGLHGHPDASALLKLGWLGSAERASQPMLYMFGMGAIFAKWLEDIRLTQAPSGEIPIIAPIGGELAGMLLSPTTTALYPTLVHRYWLAYGDTTVPARHFEAVRRHLEWVLAQLDAGDGLAQDYFGDWYPPLGGSPMPPEGGRLVGTAYVIRNLREGVALAELLGHDPQARAWRERIATLVRRFNDEFLDTAAGVYRTERAEAGYRQTSNAVPLAFGLVPEEHVDAVAANLAADVEERDRHLDTGSVGTGLLPYALSDFGNADLAHAVLSRTDYPSYGYLRELGATALWESWEPGSRAHNDPTLSEPLRWLVERVVGLETLAPGWSRFRVAPTAFGPLGHARVALDTVRGRIEVAWRRAGDRLSLTLTVPVNAVAEVRLPDGRTRELGSGSHHLASRFR